jgi:rhodanese-related sulfurtransferase
LNSFVTVSQLQKGASPQTLLVDVRSGSEFACGHIPSAVNIPMEEIEARLGDLGADLPILLVCQSGKRARMTADILEPCQREIAVLEGGTEAWIKAGLPVVASVQTRWSLERQVRLGAGLLVLVGFTLALTVNPRWMFLCAFVGLGLTLAGLTDVCPMGMILGKMPWNGRGRCVSGSTDKKRADLVRPGIDS